MNRIINGTRDDAAGCWRRVLHGLGVGCSRAMRVLGLADGMFAGPKPALRKRALERRLVEAGFSRRLAKIAVAEAFRPDRTT